MALLGAAPRAEAAVRVRIRCALRAAAAGAVRSLELEVAVAERASESHAHTLGHASGCERGAGTTDHERLQEEKAVRMRDHGGRLERKRRRGEGEAEKKRRGGETRTEEVKRRIVEGWGEDAPSPHTPSTACTLSRVRVRWRFPSIGGAIWRFSRQRRGLVRRRSPRRWCGRWRVRGGCAERA